MELNYREYSGQGEPLIILHGLFGNLKNWHSHASQLAEDYRVIAVDLRNHGDSPHADSISYPEMAADVLGLCDALDLESVRLLGHSMGGKVAMQFALSHPDRVARVLIADISPFRYGAERGDHEDVFAGLLAVDPAGLGSRSQADPVLAEHIEDVGVRQFLLSNLMPLGEGGYRWRFNLQALRAHYGQLREGVQGTAFEGPVLFVKGAESNYIKETDWARIKSLFPKAELSVIADAGHWLHAEQPKVFLKICRDFFAAGGDGR